MRGKLVKAVRLIRGAALDADRARVLVRIFEEAWSAINREHIGDPSAIESTRLELATIMLALASGRQSDFETIKATAIQLLRGNFEGFPKLHRVLTATKPASHLH
jgi:hypothetical protein